MMNICTWQTGLGREAIENAIDALIKQKLIAFNKEAKTYSLHDSVSANLQELVSDDIKSSLQRSMCRMC